MHTTLGFISEISVRGRACQVCAGPLAGRKGRVIGESFSPPDTAGRQYHIGLSVETAFGRVTLSPKDVALQDS